MSSDDKISIEYRERTEYDHSTQHSKYPGNTSTNVNAKLANPLSGIPQDQLMADASAFAAEYGLGHIEKELQKGALVAQEPTSFENISILSEDDKAVLRRELTHRWSQPGQLYYLVILCSLAAAVQGVCLFILLYMYEM